MQSEECIATEKAKEAEHQVSSAERAAYEFDFSTAKSGNISKPRSWEAFGVDGAHHAMGGLGSLGVFLINLKAEGGVIVAKQGAITSPAELYCSLLYKQFNVAAPQMRVLGMPEWRSLVDELGKVCFTSPGAGDHLQSRGLQRGAVLQEVGPGVTLKHPSIAGYLADAIAGPKLLHELGRIIALDMLVNNFDRSPMIWSHEGNANNILIKVDPDGTVIVSAIDQGVSTIVDTAGETANVDAYVAKVKAAIAEAAEQKGVGPYITKIRDFIKQWVGPGHDIGMAGCQHVQGGIMECAVEIAGNHGHHAIWQETADAFTKAGAKWGEHGVAAINVDFIESVATAIAESIP